MNLASSHETFVTKPIAIEQWRPVLGWEGIYEVSDMGRVRSLPRTRVCRPRLVAPVLLSTGYRRVTLSRNGRKKQATVHRLVLDAFVGPSELQCNHKNGNRQDNWLENLEWVTNKENTDHSFRFLGRRSVRGEECGTSKLTDEKVIEIRRRYTSGETEFAKLGRDYGVAGNTIRSVIVGRTWRE